MNTNQIPDELFLPPVAGNAETKPAPEAEPANLMPYEKVAKDIFIKANGLDTYTRAMRFVRYTD